MTKSQVERITSRAAVVAIVCGSLCGFSALYLQTTRPAAISHADAVVETVESDHPGVGAAAGFAVSMVDSWLSGDDLSMFGDSLAPSGPGLVVDRAFPVRSTDYGDGVVEVVVGVDLTRVNEASEVQSERLATRFYGVGVHVDETGAMAAYSTPSAVPSPAPAELPAGVVSGLSEPGLVDAAIAERVTGFLEAYLLGSSDLALHTRPGSDVRAFGTAPYIGVAVTKLGVAALPDHKDVELRVVTASVLATEVIGQQQLTYHLVVAKRDGRWEISQVLPLPPLS